MSFMGWITTGMALVGLFALCFGCWVLATRRLTRRLSEQYTRPADAGKYLLGFGLFFLLQVAGYVGVAVGLFNNMVRGVLVLVAFAIAVFSLVRYRPHRVGSSRV